MTQDGKYRGATPSIDGNPATITHESTDGNGHHVYTTSDGVRCAGTFAMVGQDHKLLLTPISAKEGVTA